MMFRILFFSISIYLFSCNDFKNTLSSENSNYTTDTVLFTRPTTVHFHDTLIDLGRLNQDDKKVIVYKYTNTGKNPLMLFNVSPGCGCTIAEYSHKPLAPGGTDSIIAKFDSKDKEGQYQKNIKVICNTEERVYTLAFLVQVLK